MTTYTAMPITEVPANLMRDLNTEGKSFAVVRSFEARGETFSKVWSFHTSDKTAAAAVRRGNSREIRTQ